MHRTAVVCAVLGILLVVGLAVAMHHETDALIALDKEWGAAAPGQEAVDATNRLIADDVLAIGGGGVASKADMIEAAQSEDVPAGPYVADGYQVKFLTDDVAVMVHRVAEPEPHWSLHVWQKKGDAWKVVASASAPEAEEEDEEDEAED